jgi:hypothetical protein
MVAALGLFLAAGAGMGTRAQHAAKQSNYVDLRNRIGIMKYCESGHITAGMALEATTIFTAALITSPPR